MVEKNCLISFLKIPFFADLQGLGYNHSQGDEGGASSSSSSHDRSGRSLG